MSNPSPMQQFVDMAGPFLGRNPRWCKQFAELLRLRAHDGAWSGLAVPLGEEQHPRVHLPQMAKYVLLELRWPEFLSDAVGDPGLLPQLARWAESNVERILRDAVAAAQGQAGPEETERWYRRWHARLHEMLAWVPEGADDAEGKRWSMAEFDVRLVSDSIPPPPPEEARAQQAQINQEFREPEARGEPREEEWDRNHQFSARVTEADDDCIVFSLTDSKQQSVELRCKLVPAGEFLMGSPEGIGDDDEHPQHPVRITEPFYIGIYPITQEQYEIVMGRNPSRFASSAEKPNRPVECVTWWGAAKFCELLSEKSGRQVRLPTEAQWEYACRAGSTGLYCFGNDVAPLPEYAWFGKGTEEGTDTVGKRKANNFGLYDMHGNVWEWCRDDARPYPQTTPQRPLEDPEGARDGPGRVLRGGSWNPGPYFLRSANRDRNLPSSTNLSLGFRVVIRPE